MEQTRSEETLSPFEIELQPANEDDLVRVQGILSEAARWMRDERRVLNQWPERFSDQLILDVIRAKEMYLVYSHGETVGTVRVSDSGPTVWGDDPAAAVYVHSLTVVRSHKGEGLGAKILRRVQLDAAARGRPLLRLDCLSTNQDLRHYYESLGFSHRGDAIQRNHAQQWVTSRYERSYQ
jgi:ribosomal protein S18 acetylase RimI-like enzyme